MLNTIFKIKIILFAISLVPILGHTQDKGINFLNNLSWDQVRLKAKQDGKYIFMDIFSTWCGPCKLMDKRVYPNETVGRFMNEKFISLKVQADSTVSDNQNTKRWYSDAKIIFEKYHIDAFPTFLFFSPDGKLIYRNVGINDVESVNGFINMVKNAQDSNNIKYYSQIAEYKDGKRDYSVMCRLAATAKKMGDDNLFVEIAEDYTAHLSHDELLSKDNIDLVFDLPGKREMAKQLAGEYFKKQDNKLSDEDLCEKDNLNFINKFGKVVNSKNRIFWLCYSQPKKIDSAIESEGWAANLVSLVIKKEELGQMLFKDGRAIAGNPDWNKLKSEILKKYPKVNVDQLILEYQVFFYRKSENWIQWAIYQNKKIKTSPLDSGEEFIELNLPAWDAFLHCCDTVVLRQALEWSFLALKIDVSDPNLQIVDTYANLNYKLGKFKEAIAQEQFAIALSQQIAKKQRKEKGPYIDVLTATLSKMQERLPTYLEEWAIWDSKLLPVRVD